MYTCGTLIFKLLFSIVEKKKKKSMKLTLLRHFLCNKKKRAKLKHPPVTCNESSVPSLLAFVHTTLNIAERIHNRRSMKNSINVCVLINRSKVDRFNGAVAVLFCISFVSCPV
ncbi:hypothetical protein PUN28_010714 [Cardiocondyla obscurior]|uniref:Uncharacterized protein n=1 Tax=Cardiocondyla obscurior TaxID=286306 RepID=A0AAW2FK10_9HYME